MHQARNRHRRGVGFALASLLILQAAGAAAAGPSGSELWKMDFESGKAPTPADGLEFRRAQVELVAGGAGGSGHALQLRTPEPATSCGLNLCRPVTIKKNLTLSFDHREEIEPGHTGAYLGISFHVGDEQWFWTSDEFSPKWRHVEVPLATLRGSAGKTMRPGLVFTRVQLYAKVQPAPSGDAVKARVTVWFDNLRLHAAPRESKLSEVSRDSDSNPPLFNWPAPASTTRTRLQYATDATFPAQGTVTVDVPVNFHTPAAPLPVGTYYWRVRTETDLLDGWSDIEQVRIGPEAHRFTTAPVVSARLETMPHPRLRACARLGAPELDGLSKVDLVKRARKIHAQGVPEHPGPHVEGDPRWPTWIEWYGKVAGRITGGTGRRLETLGRCAMLTGDPETVGWAKELLLKACDWDPDGGSAMRRGDIGAHHLLRGLNWCYDAAHAALSDAERARCREIIARRAEQFQSRLNPFRGAEANNHAWLQAFGLAETGLVLAGEHPGAADWVEYVRQLYLGRFLPCLGYQGDNNEGIGYWDYGLGFVIGYADMMRAVFDIDLYRHPWLSQTARFPMYCALPDAWAVSFADTGMPNHGTRGPAATGKVRELALRTRDPNALWYSGVREAVDGLGPRAPVDLPSSIHYRKIGLAIFNTSLVDGREAVTVALHSGPYQAGHQHPDQNAFVLHAYGDKLAIDGGYYDWYGSPHFKAYSMTSLAHNTLLVNGKGQAACTRGADGRILAWHDSPGYGYVAGDAADPDIYGGALDRFERRLLFIKPGLVIVHDVVSAAQGRAASFDWLLHALAPIRIDAGAAAFEFAQNRAALRGRWIAPTRIVQDVTTGFPVEPVNRYGRDPVPPDLYFPEWILHAKPAEASVHEEFLAAMQVRRLDPQPDPAAEIDPFPAANALGARVKIGERTHLILVRSRDARGEIRGGGLESDGAVAAVELDASGRALRAFYAGATRVRFDGRTLWSRESPGCGEAGPATPAGDGR